MSCQQMNHLMKAVPIDEAMKIQLNNWGSEEVGIVC